MQHCGWRNCDVVATICNSRSLRTELGTCHSDDTLFYPDGNITWYGRPQTESIVASVLENTSFATADGHVNYNSDGSLV